MVQEDYHSDNPYHNAVHAADVTQAMYCFMREPKVRRAKPLSGFQGGRLAVVVVVVIFLLWFVAQLAKSLTSCDLLLGLLAAATHDLDHPGVNQPFLIKTNHYLATLYKVNACYQCNVRSAAGHVTPYQTFQP